MGRVELQKGGGSLPRVEALDALDSLVEFRHHRCSNGES